MCDSRADALLEALQRFEQRSGGRAQISVVALALQGQQVQLVLQALDGLLHILMERNTVTFLLRFQKGL